MSKMRLSYNTPSKFYLTEMNFACKMVTYALLAQRIERSAPDRKVAGSIPVECVKRVLFRTRFFYCIFSENVFSSSKLLISEE